MLTLNTSIEELTKVGKTVASRLKYLGIVKVVDLLNYYPFRYDDFSVLKNINDLKPGDIATVKGKIELLANKRSFKKKMFITECFLSDETGSIKATWFAQPFIAKVLKNGDEVYLAGKVDGDLFNHYLKNPSYEKVSDQTTHTARLVPIYPSTEGISQKQLRFLSKQALSVVNEIKDDLPEQIKTFWQLIGLVKALKQIHFPENRTELKQARTRLKFDELLGWHLQNLLLKKDLQESLAAPIQFNEEQTKKLVNNLSFQLTDAQRKSAWQILKDMAQTKPMNRLLEGDVGAGKTVVAALAIANAALNNVQSALLAPTEILAYQHFVALKEILTPISLNVALLTRSKNQVFNTADQEPSVLSKAKLLKTIAGGEIQLVIGTQALLEDKVVFSNLGLVVIDEQHRFGVEQRQKLREKSGSPRFPSRLGQAKAEGEAGDRQTTPHFLSMTATPIPRTLALTLYGDLELSVLDELPPNRKKPITQLFSSNQRNRAYEFILEKIKEGRQCFIICPLIEESDKLGVKAATEEYQKLTEEIFPQLTIGLLHGRLKPKDKDKAMAEFAGGQTDILVATSVVEVGVNIPNAAVMIIESAERFGLAQLHQFRGRVNRSSHQSYCLLFTNSDSEKSLNRLNTLVNCYDGFKLAEEDLKQRGSGNLTGSEQSGWWQFKIASLADVKLIEETKKAANIIASDYPEFIQRLKDATVIHPE